jgi:site-specific DNA-cytosine methylase
MKQEHQDVISEYLGVVPIMINSALMSAQNIVRLYWTNIPNVSQPDDKGLVLADILEHQGEVDRSKSYCIDANYWKGGNRRSYFNDCRRQLVFADGAMRGRNREGERNVSSNCVNYRKLTPVECERLQTVPDGYTESVSNTQRYRMLGNGFTVDVISHILRNMDV